MTRPRRLLSGLALVLIVVGGAVAWRKALWPQIAPKNFGVVQVDDQRQIYRAGELTVSATEKVVERFGVRTIIDLGAHEPGTPEERIAQRTAEALGVRRIRLDLEGDATGDPNEYVEALRIMTDPAAQPVLVHCAAGAERTGCLVAMYRQIEQGWDDDLAYRETRLYRHSPERNPRVREMLDRYTGAVERALETGEPIEYDPANPSGSEPAASSEDASEGK
ncbi:MAG: tyrosine-protein phosphatase [Phycisphaerales bacterium JB039]